MKALSSFSRILFCADFSDESLNAFDHALELAAAGEDSEIQLLHVVPEPDAQFWKTYLYELDNIDDKARADIDRRMAETYLSRVGEGQRIRVKMAVGSPAQELFKTIEEEKSDLLILARPAKGSGGFLMHDGTKEAIRKAPCPVLVIPARS